MSLKLRIKIPLGKWAYLLNIYWGEQSGRRKKFREKRASSYVPWGSRILRSLKKFYLKTCLQIQPTPFYSKTEWCFKCKRWITSDIFGPGVKLGYSHFQDSPQLFKKKVIQPSGVIRTSFPCNLPGRVLVSSLQVAFLECNEDLFTLPSS